MKKFFTLLLALAMLLTLTGCYSANMLDKEALPPDEVPPIYGDIPAESVPQWGLTFEVEDVTPTGMTLIVHQKDGVELTGQINTGTPFGLKMLEKKAWVDMPLLRDDITWNTIAYAVPTGGEFVQSLNWSQLYGELPTGEYLLVKEFMDFRGTGDYDTFTFSVPFTVE